MSSLMKFCKIPTTQIRPKNCVYLYNIVRNSGTRDYAPGPYPRTEEEMAKAAEKYNLPRADYKPMPDDGNAIGDYPDVERISGDARSNYYPWDYPALKRNFNETLPIDANILGEDRLDINTRPRYSATHCWLAFLGTMTTFITLFYIGEEFKRVQPVGRKQYPVAGETHYTFEHLK